MSFVSSSFSFELREFVARYVGLKPAVRCCAGSDTLASGIGLRMIAACRSWRCNSGARQKTFVADFCRQHDPVKPAANAINDCVAIMSSNHAMRWDGKIFLRRERCLTQFSA
ncbi:hypothetical protein IVB27_23085 [Bradyrhizobium sp. 197]|uniref:hypothetical protein n=1 Tax=Bradyrhizobium sp. 197 TaxID=2782663 RepID=UPI001FF856DE|nr:hypothetical protein [Bradyrhizobium sp. 197]MCK1477611.1 hypothetical protein [Bradyrhizobium sp. 197]